MTDDRTPHDPTDDPFAGRLADRLRSAAAPIDAAAVTRGAIAQRTHDDLRRRRTTAVVGAVAATVVLVAGLAAVASPGSAPTAEEVDVAGPAEIGAPGEQPCPTIGELRVDIEAGDRTVQGVLDTAVFDDGLTEGELLYRLADAAPGTAGSAVSDSFTQEQIDALMAYATTLEPDQDGRRVQAAGEADSLRQAGLLTAAQEAALAAGEEIGLSDEQVQYLADEGLIPPSTTTTVPGNTTPVLPLASDGIRVCLEPEAAVEPGATSVPATDVAPTSDRATTTYETTATPGPAGCDGPIQAGSNVLFRPAGDQPEGTVDLLLLLPPHVDSLREAGLITDEQLALAGNGIFVWVTAEQQGHLTELEPEVVYPQAFHYATYPSRSGGEAPVVVEVDPACVAVDGE